MSAISPGRTRTGLGPAPSKWLPQLAPRPHARLRLFCFPYAGGDALTIFRKWPEMLPAMIEICPVQIPGRGSRVTEPLFNDLLSVVKAIAEALRHHRDKPFVFFGHSMGAIIGFELARLFRSQYGMEPQMLFVSGRRAPQIPDTEPLTYNLPQADFVKELEKINGTPREVLENPELMQLMLPILKADFQACQTYAYTAGSPLRCPIVSFGGLTDDTTREELEAWGEQTANRFSLHVVPGDHFFIRHHEDAVLRIIESRLREVLARL